MGSRLSASAAPAAAAAAAAASSSAKVITISGVLKEYAAAPIPASVVLADCCEPPATEPDPSPCFLCNADSLSYDDAVPALSHHDPLLPGQLYFVLPDGMQRRVLSGADMGALAVRASRALEAAAGSSSPSGGGGRRCGKQKKKARALKVSPVLVESIVGNQLDGLYGDDNQRTVSVLSSSTSKRPAQLKKSGVAVAAAAGQKKGAGARGSRYGRRGGSFRGRLGTIEEDAE